ncbi:MAG: hypothetical protein OHK0024_15240 [Thalassobaculales bacterium]
MGERRYNERLHVPALRVALRGVPHLPLDVSLDGFRVPLMLPGLAVGERLSGVLSSVAGGPAMLFIATVLRVDPGRGELACRFEPMEEASFDCLIALLAEAGGQGSVGQGSGGPRLHATGPAGRRGTAAGPRPFTRLLAGTLTGIAYLALAVAVIGVPLAVALLSFAGGQSGDPFGTAVDPRPVATDLPGRGAPR